MCAAHSVNAASAGELPLIVRAHLRGREREQEAEESAVIVARCALVCEARRRTMGEKEGRKSAAWLLFLRPLFFSPFCISKGDERERDSGGRAQAQSAQNDARRTGNCFHGSVFDYEHSLYFILDSSTFRQIFHYF